MVASADSPHPFETTGRSTNSLAELRRMRKAALVPKDAPKTPPRAQENIRWSGSRRLFRSLYLNGSPRADAAKFDIVAPRKAMLTARKEATKASIAANKRYQDVISAPPVVDVPPFDPGRATGYTAEPRVSSRKQLGEEMRALVRTQAGLAATADDGEKDVARTRPATAREQTAASRTRTSLKITRMQEARDFAATQHMELSGRRLSLTRRVLESNRAEDEAFARKAKGKTREDLVAARKAEVREAFDAQQVRQAAAKAVHIAPDAEPFYKAHASYRERPQFTSRTELLEARRRAVQRPATAASVRLSSPASARASDKSSAPSGPQRPATAAPKRVGRNNTFTVDLLEDRRAFKTGAQVREEERSRRLARERGIAKNRAMYDPQMEEPMFGSYANESMMTGVMDSIVGLMVTKPAPGASLDGHGTLDVSISKDEAEAMEQTLASSAAPDSLGSTGVLEGTTETSTVRAPRPPAAPRARATSSDGPVNVQKPRPVPAPAPRAKRPASAPAVRTGGFQVFRQRLMLS